MSQFVFPPLTANLNSEATNGGSLPSSVLVVAGYDGANVRAIKTDSTGEVQVDISSSALPSGAATSALQTAGNNLLTTIDADTSILSAAIKNIQSAQGTTDPGLPALVVRNDTLADLSGADGDYTPLQVNASGALYTTVHSSELPTGAATSALQTSGNTLLGTIDADTSILAGAVSSGQMQVDVVASLPAGTNNIGDVDIASALPAGTNNIGDVDIASALPAGTNTIGKVDVNAIAPVDFLDAGVVDASTLSGNIPTSGSSELVTNLAAACTEIEVVDDIGEFMSLRAEASTGGGYNVKAYLPLGGGRVKVSLAAGDGIKLFSETGTTISSGKIAINFLG